MCPEAMMMGTATTMATSPEEGLDPSCTNTYLLQVFKDYPSLEPNASSHHEQPLYPMTPGKKPSSYLPAACSSPQVAADSP